MKAHQDLADFARLLIVNSWQISILKGDRKDSYGANFPLRCVASKGGAFGLFINVSNPCPRRLRPLGMHPARTPRYGPYRGVRAGCIPSGRSLLGHGFDTLMKSPNAPPFDATHLSGKFAPYESLRSPFKILICHEFTMSNLAKSARS